VLMRHGSKALRWRWRRMWGVLLEYGLSLAWAYAMLTIMVLWALGLVVDLPASLHVESILPRWPGVVLAMVCLLQFGTSLLVERRYEPKFARHFYWVIWYPIAFWLIGMLTAVTALPKTLLQRRRRAVWTSPDRGLT